MVDGLTKLLFGSVKETETGFFHDWAPFKEDKFVSLRDVQACIMQSRLEGSGGGGIRAITLLRERHGPMMLRDAVEIYRRASSYYENELEKGITCRPFTPTD